MSVVLSSVPQVVVMKRRWCGGSGVFSVLVGRKCGKWMTSFGRTIVVM